MPIMSTYVMRLVPPRPTFMADMSDEEREIMGRHGAHWRPYIESGQMVVFGPVSAESGAWGLGVIETDDEAAVRETAATDPVVTSGIGTVEIGTFAGFLRPSAA
jgi:uncharacterized protein YciI